MHVVIGRRILWLSLFALLALAGLGYRLYQIQVVHGPQYARMAYLQRTLVLPVGETRGRILDRNGQPLTDPRPTWGVAVFPPLVREPEEVAGLLWSVLKRGPAAEKLSPDAIVTNLTRRPHEARWLVRGITEQTAQRIAALGLPGITVGPVTERYGEGALARHLVGYLNAANGRPTGQLGLEALFDAELNGEAVPAMVTYLDGLGDPLTGLGIRTMKPLAGKEPYDVQTTIDRHIQAITEDVLDRTPHPDGGPMRGAVVVMDPHTGDVLAMASRPQLPYDEAAFDAALQDRAASPFVNRAVRPFAPGSVFKPIVAAEALEQGLVSLQERFNCTGRYDIGPTRFRDPGGRAHGSLTFQQAVAQSCNVTFLRLGHQRMGEEMLRQAARRFGFGMAPGGLGEGRSLDAREAGHVPEPGDASTVQIALGQGSLAVTPLQVARAYSAIANGGVLPPVRLVTAVKSPAGAVVTKPAAGQGVRILSRATVRDLQQALQAVTYPEGKGTGKAAWVAQGGSAGKTGTAEVTPAIAHAWFAGYLPLAEPRYVIVVFVEQGGSGGRTAAPIFRAIGERILALE